jgi:hypothetical protein
MLVGEGGHAFVFQQIGVAEVRRTLARLDRARNAVERCPCRRTSA